MLVLDTKKNRVRSCWRCSRTRKIWAWDLCKSCYHMYLEWSNPKKYKERRSQYKTNHKEQISVYMKKRYDNNRNMFRTKSKQNYINNLERARHLATLRIEANFIYALDVFGEHKCAWCGDSNLTHFQFDHIDNYGTRERRNGGLHGEKLYRWIITRPEESRQKYQILCASCNQEKRYRVGSRVYHHRKY